jgi:hypothetical protein
MQKQQADLNIALNDHLSFGFYQLKLIKNLRLEEARSWR